MRTNASVVHAVRLSRLAVVSLVAVVLLVEASCGRSEPDESRSGREEIVVAAASNLTDAFEELAKAFTAKSSIRIVYSFGATADLSRQIRGGAPFDVFAAADVVHVEELEREGLLTPGSRAPYGRGRLVLWMPEGSRLRLARLEDLKGAGVSRIAVAKPDVAPYGEAAVEALRALNLWEEIEPKVVYAQNVSQARQFAASGNADAAFLPRSLVRKGEGASVEVEERLHRPIEQALGVLKASGRQDAARRFAEYVLSEEGQALLERYGYARVAVASR